MLTRSLPRSPTESQLNCLSAPTSIPYRPGLEIGTSPVLKLNTGNLGSSVQLISLEAYRASTSSFILQRVDNWLLECALVAYLDLRPTDSKLRLDSPYRPHAWLRLTSTYSNGSRLLNDRNLNICLYETQIAQSGEAQSIVPPIHQPRTGKDYFIWLRLHRGDIYLSLTILLLLQCRLD